MKKLFGTDGIRGVANRHPMTIEVAARVGRALAGRYCTARAKNILIAQDTRQSGDMLASSLVAGILSAGGNACPLGILPTPAVSRLAFASADNVAGVMISASHNPYQDNGLKIFKGDGYKLSDEEEALLESAMARLGSGSGTGSDDGIIGRIIPYDQGASEYLEFLTGCADNPQFLKGTRLILDCSNGATFRVARQLYASLGAEVATLSDDPDGTNINAGCGSQHPETLSAAVVQQQAHAGLAFDGDGDRLIAVDEQGQVLSGDQIILACALNLKSKGELANNTLVTTVMSNLGLRRALETHGISHCMADVGDRYVLQMMQFQGSCLGGEDSGHMIFLNDHHTGDGLLSGIRLLEAMRARQSRLSDLRGLMQTYPQVLINIPVKSKPPLDQFPAIARAVQGAEAQLQEDGRVLLRYSGTSLKCRVMVEGPHQAVTESLAQQIAGVVQKELGCG